MHRNSGCDCVCGVLSADQVLQLLCMYLRLYVWLSPFSFSGLLHLLHHWPLYINVDLAHVELVCLPTLLLLTCILCFLMGLYSFSCIRYLATQLLLLASHIIVVVVCAAKALARCTLQPCIAPLHWRGDAMAMVKRCLHLHAFTSCVMQPRKPCVKTSDDVSQSLRHLSLIVPDSTKLVCSPMNCKCCTSF
jgi:hypothetical protein